LENHSIYNSLQKIKYLGISLTKEVKALYNENYKLIILKLKPKLSTRPPGSAVSDLCPLSSATPFYAIFSAQCIHICSSVHSKYFPTYFLLAYFGSTRGFIVIIP
jgi:hypothetical protein